MSETAQRHCDQCSRPFTPPAFAPGKRFCCGKCRNDWHLERRKKALAQLQEQEKQER